MHDKDATVVAPECPVCLDVVCNPTRAKPCGHLFCLECVETLVKASGEKPDCPMCRAHIDDLDFDQEAQQGMDATQSECEGCKTSMVMSTLRAHRAFCAPYQAMQRAQASQAPTATVKNVVNRSTFRCPFPNCTATNMEHKGLIEHLDSAHFGMTCAAVCPVCLSMPWGDPNYISHDVVGHIKLRHRFEYNEFVDYEESENEQAMLQAVLAQSMQDR